jgi:hypothetical protein
LCCFILRARQSDFPDDEIHISMNCSYRNIVTTTATGEEKVRSRSVASGRTKSASDRTKSDSGHIKSASGRNKSTSDRIKSA